MKLDAERMRNLEFAALLHDVGKIAIPKEIINKPGKLNAHEWTIIKTHTLAGQRMLDRVGGFMREVGHIVRSHHERWDGTGYPDGLAGEQIPLESRIIACCDTWNAMRTDRVYRTALTEAAALAEIHTVAGSQLDPHIAEVLLRIVLGRSRRPIVPKLTAPAPTASRRTRPRPIALSVDDSLLEDIRAADPVERLLEDSWETRDRHATRRELIAEAAAGPTFLAVAVPMALPAIIEGRVPLGTAALLVFLYALVRTIRFQIGAGAIVPSYLVLVPMLLLLPPSTVPLLAGIGLVLGTSLRVLAERSNPQDLLFSLPDGWHTIGPALVLMLAGHPQGGDKVAVTSLRWRPVSSSICSPPRCANGSPSGSHLGCSSASSCSCGSWMRRSRRSDCSSLRQRGLSRPGYSCWCRCSACCTSSIATAPRGSPRLSIGSASSPASGPDSRRRSAASATRSRRSSTWERSRTSCSADRSTRSTRTRDVSS